MTHGDLEVFRRLFWMRRDPDPATRENETLDLYLGRVRLLAAEFKDTGVRVNSVNPGATRTPMRAAAYPAEDPLTLPIPEEIGEVFVQLASPARP